MRTISLGVVARPSVPLMTRQDFGYERILPQPTRLPWCSCRPRGFATLWSLKLCPCSARTGSLLSAKIYPDNFEPHPVLEVAELILSIW